MFFDLSRRRKQAVSGLLLAQYWLFRPVQTKPVKNLG